ncbi:transcription factor B1 [Leptinotarsa decemlineata]|uniref:transcription factor B1 n=1 Tax=Leptinotarsa decemlineata TaxID=7539 RepID=UPI000C253CCF|nr:general transcription factor IIH subunit 1 [Leptinotarsa decemlineata]
MSTSMEDVLLQVPHVRYKKGDGSLFLMDQRLIWMVENKDTVVVSHPYADIKSQKISPEGKAKVQLQVVLHNGVSSTFHFTNKNGLEAQLADRDKIKEMLQSLLPKFKRKVDKELEEKNKLLSSNPALLQLYKDLVITEVVSSEEFWSQHAQQYTQKQKQQPQEIGVSGAFLADIKPQTDGCNGLKYNITPDIIECIFKTYPAVKKKYIDNVPSKLSESQFWTKFFQSHYFHRDRKYAESKDIFTECGKIDDQEMKKDIQSGVKDPLVNLTEFEDKTFDEGFGIATEQSSTNTGTVSQAMIKRFNQHSIMVLKSSKNQGSDTPVQENGLDPKTSSTNGLKPGAKVRDDGSVSKRQRILEKITYDDLEDTSESTIQKGVPLSLSKVERYLHGPMPDSATEYWNANEASAVLRGVAQETKQWGKRHPSNNLVSPAAAVGALGELSPGGALMRGFQEQSLAELVPADIEKEVRNLYLALCELLHHFWHCFPPTSSNSEVKLVKMHEALNRFHTAKLKPFEDKLMRELSPLSHHLTKHLNQLLNAAYQKFNNWQKVKGR